MFTKFIRMVDQCSLSAKESLSDDDISLTSSDSEQEEEYTVEEILAERLCDDLTPRYLVKWENYGEHRCDICITLIPSLRCAACVNPIRG